MADTDKAIDHPENGSLSAFTGISKIIKSVEPMLFFYCHDLTRCNPFHSLTFLSVSPMKLNQWGIY